jgi:hypothetical protein
VSEFISRHAESLGRFALSHRKFEVLQDILTILNIAYEVQELLSSEQTPTLSLTFPLYDSLLNNWRAAIKLFPEYESAILAGIGKIEDYVLQSRSSPIHVLVMVLDPSIKYGYIDTHWEPEEQATARTIVQNFVCVFRSF